MKHLVYGCASEVGAIASALQMNILWTKALATIPAIQMKTEARKTLRKEQEAYET
jgi:hypothetical protein